MRISRSTAVVGGIVLVAVLSTRYVTLNISSSVPLGLYRRIPVPTPLARGDLVILPVPASAQVFHSRWLPLLKPVAAIEGDSVCCADSGELWIGDEDYGAVVAEIDGRPLPRLNGCITIPDGYVFLASVMRRSLDSRYFGAVPITALSAGAVPLLVWR